MDAPFISAPIGDGRRCFIVAEAGVNHDGDLDRARALIDAAAEAGADAIKFQTFTAAATTTAAAPKAAYQMRHGTADETQQAMLERLELDEQAHRDLAAHAKAQHIAFLSSPFDGRSAAMLVDMGVELIKIGSGEVTNLPLLRRVGELHIPVVLSTGMCYLGEIETALDALRHGGCEAIILLHCVSCYPADPAEANLRAMDTLRRAFQLPTGYSDHTPGTAVALAACARGACLIEKHLTLDRSLPGPDHRASIEPDTFAAMVRDIRLVESALGDGIKRPIPGEQNLRATARRALVTSRNLDAGHVIEADDLDCLRPGTGIQPALMPQVIGRPVRHELPAGHTLDWGDLS